MADRFYTAKEAAAYLSTPERDVSAAAVKDWTRKGLLKGKRLGNMWVYKESDLATFELPIVPDWHWTQQGREKTW